MGMDSRIELSPVCCLSGLVQNLLFLMTAFLFLSYDVFRNENKMKY